MDDDSDAEDGAAKTAVGRKTKASLPVSRASLRFNTVFLIDFVFRIQFFI